LQTPTAKLTNQQGFFILGTLPVYEASDILADTPHFAGEKRKLGTGIFL
jgi:hypothetical protein